MIPIISLHGHCIVSLCANKDLLFGSLGFRALQFSWWYPWGFATFHTTKEVQLFPLLIMPPMLPYPVQYLPIPLSKAVFPQSLLIEFQWTHDSSWQIRFYLLKILNWTLEIRWDAWTEKWCIAEMEAHVWAKYLPKQNGQRHREGKEWSNVQREWEEKRQRTKESISLLDSSIPTSS